MTKTAEDSKNKQEPGLREKMLPISASAGATVTSSVLCSFLPLGTRGTLIGLAGGSVMSGVAAALYERWMRGAHRKIRDKGFRKPAEADAWDRYYRPREAARRRDIPWRNAAVIGGASMLLCAGGITAAEAFAGKPLSSVVSGKAGHGTTWSGSSYQQPAPPATPYISPSPSPPPSSSVTVTPSPTAAVTPSPSGSWPSPSPSVTAVPSPQATVTPSPSSEGTVQSARQPR